MAASDAPAPSTGHYPVPSIRVFSLIIILLICGAVVRSAIATRLDDFTLDEPYHIVEDHSPTNTVFRRDLDKHLRFFDSSVSTSQIPALRDPSLE